MFFVRRWQGCVCCLLFALSFFPVDPVTVFAQTPAAAGRDEAAGEGEEALRRKRQSIYRALLKKPADLDLNFAYAALSARLGDYEGAITALERMLIFAPDLPRVKLELGVMYFRLGSFVVAQSYFLDALEAEDVPKTVAERVKKYLAAIDKQLSRHKFTGTAFLGLRYQSNANGAPSDADIDIKGTTFRLDDSATAQSDIGVTGFVRGQYSYDFFNQGDKIEIDGILFMSGQKSEEQLNSRIIELRGGLSFDLAKRDWGVGRVKPYLLLGHVSLDENGYSRTFGLGGVVDKELSARWYLSGRGEIRNLHYNNTAANPTLSSRNGNEYALSATFIYRPPLDWGRLKTPVLSLLGGAERRQADQDFQSRTIWRANVALNGRFDLRDRGIERPWDLSFLGSFRNSSYDAPDTTLSTSDREDREWLFRATLGVPVRDDLSVLFVYQLRDTRSNYDIYDYTDHSVTIGLAWQF